MWGTSGLDMPRDEARVGPTVIYLLYTVTAKERRQRVPLAPQHGEENILNVTTGSL